MNKEEEEEVIEEILQFLRDSYNRGMRRAAEIARGPWHIDNDIWDQSNGDTDEGIALAIEKEAKNETTKSNP